MNNLITIFTVFSLITLTRSAEDENDFSANPIIECGSSDVRVTLNTMDVFYGEMYVSGKSDVKECRRGDGALNNQPSITLMFGTCGLSRVRTELPQGMT